MGSGGLWEHQVRGIKFTRANNWKALFGMGMGSGKTRTTITCLTDSGIQDSENNVLVICPAATVDVFPTQMRQYAGDVCWDFVPTHTPRGGPMTSQKKRDALLAHLDARKAAGGSTGPLTMVCGYEAARSEILSKLLLATRWDAIICDESHRIKTASSQVGRLAGKLAKKNPSAVRLALTGTPMPLNELDVWGQARFVDSSVLEPSFYAHKQKWAIMGGYGGHKIVGIRDKDRLAELFSKFMFTVRTEDCIDLPAVHEVHVPIHESVTFSDRYHRMVEQFVSELDDGEPLTAVNAAVKLLRLAQLTSDSPAKRAWLKDFVADVDLPVVVFCRFTEDLVRVREAAANAGRAYGEVSGSRKDLGPGGTWPEGVDVLGVQIDAGGLGIDLTRASKAAFYSLGYRADSFEQAKARLVRPGQGAHVTFFYPEVEGTIDSRIVAALEAKMDAAEFLLQMVREQQDGKVVVSWSR